MPDKDDKQGHKQPSPANTLMAQLVELFSVKSVMSLALIGGTLWGFFAGIVPSEFFVGIVSSVVTYYFMRQSNK